MKRLLLIISGILIAVVVLTGIRLLTFKDHQDTHFHANFAIFINGQKKDFSSSRFMEPVSSCTTSDEETPQTAIQRVHLHNNNGDSIHVHDNGVTWNAFLNNIRYNAGKDYIVTDDGTIFVNNEVNKVRYVLNGEFIENPMNYEIKSEDRLLVNYGAETDEQLKSRANEVSDSADELNHKNDPATCSGHTETDFWTKLKKSFVN